MLGALAVDLLKDLFVDGVGGSGHGHDRTLATTILSMTPPQRIALAHPCYLAGETIHPRFRSQTGAWSLVLTINTGYE